MLGLILDLGRNGQRQVVRDRFNGAQRLPDGRAFTSSPWAYASKVFCVNEDGLTFVLRAGDRFELLHTNALAEDDMCMATPAIAGDRLLIRTTARIYCIRNAGPRAAVPVGPQITQINAD